MVECRLHPLREPVVGGEHAAAEREPARDSPDQDEREERCEADDEPALPRPAPVPPLARSRRAWAEGVVIPPEAPPAVPLHGLGALFAREGRNPALEPSPAIDTVRLFFAGGRHPAGYGS